MFPGLLLLCPCSLSRPQSVSSLLFYIKANTFKKKTPHCVLSSFSSFPFSSFVHNCVHIRTYVRFRRRLPKHQLLSLTRPLTSYIYVGSTKGNNEKRNEMYAFIVLLSMDYVVLFSIQYIFYESSWSFNKLIFPHLCCHHLSLRPLFLFICTDISPSSVYLLYVSCMYVTSNEINQYQKINSWFKLNRICITFLFMLWVTRRRGL